MLDLNGLKGGLIVSCQAGAESPLAKPEILAAMALAGEQAGAVGIRANGPANVSAIAAMVTVPIIGIYKLDVPGYEVYITPTFKEAAEIAAAGASIIALDATNRPRPGPDDTRRLIARIHDELGVRVMADISTLAEGVAAAEAGADIVASTMSGYTPYTADRHNIAGPDLELIRMLTNRVKVPVVCEGRVHRPDEARAALEAGAYAVVVGTAITATGWIAQQYVKAMKGNI